MKSGIPASHNVSSSDASHGMCVVDFIASARNLSTFPMTASEGVVISAANVILVNTSFWKSLNSRQML